MQKIGNYYIAAVRDSSAKKSMIYYSSDIASGWQQSCLESYSIYTDPGYLCIAGSASQLVAVGLHHGDSMNPSIHSCDYNVSYTSDPGGSWSTSKIYFKGTIEVVKDVTTGETEEREVEGLLSMEPQALAYGGGLYVIAVWQGNNLRMLSASSPNAAYWEQGSFIAADEEASVMVSNMIYANGEFVACGFVQTQTISGSDLRGSYRPFIAHTAFPAGRWQSGMIDSSTCALSRLSYQNGMFTALGEDADEKLYVYYALSASGPWSRRYITDSNACGDIVYADGYWLISYRGVGEYENSITAYGTNVGCEHIAITDDLASGRILKYCYNRDPYGDPYVDTLGYFNEWTVASRNTRMCYDNGKLALLGDGKNLLVGDFPFENFDMVYP